jgi:hypothetical protein
MLITPTDSSLWSLLVLALKLNFGARTCSISKDAEMAFSILLTASTISPLSAFGSAMRFVNCAWLFVSLSLVHLPII